MSKAFWIALPSVMLLVAGAYVVTWWQCVYMPEHPDFNCNTQWDKNGRLVQQQLGLN